MVSTEEQVKDIIAKTFNLPSAEMIDTADVFQDLRADSLEAIELVVALESAFSIEIPDEDVLEKDHISVGDIVDYIRGKIAA